MRTEEGVFQNYRGQDLSYRLILPQKTESNKPLPTAVLVHGFGGSMDSRYITHNVPHLVDAGMGVFTFNMCNPHKDRMCTKELTPKNALEDVTCAFDFVKSDARLDKDNLVGVAASFGAFTMMRYAAQTQDPALKELILYSAVPDPLKPFREKVTWRHQALWRMLGHIHQEIEGDRCAISYQCYQELKGIDLHQEVAPHIIHPVTFVQGAQDNLAKPEDIQALRNGMTQAPYTQLHVLPKGEHSFALEARDDEAVSEMDQVITWTRDRLMIMLNANNRDMAMPARKSILRRLWDSIPNMFGRRDEGAKKDVPSFPVTQGGGAPWVGAAAPRQA